MRGEHNHPIGMRVSERGSPPHTRGAPRPLCRHLVDTGITPACAGSTRQSDMVQLDALGSSPHARGAHERLLLDPVHRRIIPACAGSTVDGKPPRSASTDHPACAGNTRPRPRRSPATRESSMHARGARGHRRRSITMSRIIPACAGSTDPALTDAAAPQGHPRMRAEHILDKSLTVTLQGSSPHARGALGRLPGRHRSPGIIPACAGSTRAMRSPRRRRRDRPRMRGEHLDVTLVNDG